MPGINGKMNELQAALGLLVADIIDEERKRRLKLIDRYRQLLGDVRGITLLKEQPGVKSSCQYFVIRIDAKIFGKTRDYVYGKFKEYNVFTRKYFYPLCSNYTCYEQLPSSALSNLPAAHKVVNEVLSLPLYGELSTDDVERISAILMAMR